MILKVNNFSIKQIAESGQCFRMNEISKDKYSLIAFDRYIELRQINRSTIDITCNEDEYKKIWYNYFHMGYDYERIYNKLLDGEDPFLKEAASYGWGIRILAQDPFEILISFIISQNKNIPAIKSSLEAICKMFGKCKRQGSICYYTFPTPQALSEASLEQLRQAKLGYRDKYVLNAAKTIAKGEVDLEALKKMDHTKALEILNSFYGVGEKVANCISLFGLHHLDRVPVDVWIGRVLEEVYDNKFTWDPYKEYAGIIQQYMFYYSRRKQ